MEILLFRKIVPDFGNGGNFVILPSRSNKNVRKKKKKNTFFSMFRRAFTGECDFRLSVSDSFETTSASLSNNNTNNSVFQKKKKRISPSLLLTRTTRDNVENIRLLSRSSVTIRRTAFLPNTSKDAACLFWKQIYSTGGLRS